VSGHDISAISTYLLCATELDERVAQVEGLLEPAARLPLGLFAVLGAAEVTIAVVADSFGALFLGCLGL
jgi:hypothetical protein